MPPDRFYAKLRQRARRVSRPFNPLADPLVHVKQLLSTTNRGRAKIEFSPIDVQHIRAKFLATQKDFARLIGISPETLRNWEKGRRRPHGPARALLRAINADPVALARALNWHAREWRPEPDDWVDD
jgi:putative transcriptional regulator